MKELFHVYSESFLYFDWFGRPHKNYRGPLIPGGTVAALHGGFGDMLFQGAFRPFFDMWMSDYQTIKSFKVHSTLDYRCIQLSALIKNSIRYNQEPFGWSDHKEYEINLSHSLAIDNKVKFEKDVHYSTCDFHFKPAIFELLMNFMPELVYPFLNDYYAGREVRLFDPQTFPNREILDHIKSMISLVTDENHIPFLLDLRGILLLINVFLWKAEITQRRGIGQRQAQIAQNVNRAVLELINTDIGFRGIQYYSHLVGMSPTLFKESFRKEMGASVFQFWQNDRLEYALRLLLTTQMPINLIALEVGYATSQALSKAFQKKYNMSPSAIRKEEDWLS